MRPVPDLRRSGPDRHPGHPAVLLLPQRVVGHRVGEVAADPRPGQPAPGGIAVADDRHTLGRQRKEHAPHAALPWLVQHRAVDRHRVVRGDESADHDQGGVPSQDAERCCDLDPRGTIVGASAQHELVLVVVAPQHHDPHLGGERGAVRVGTKPGASGRQRDPIGAVQRGVTRKLPEAESGADGGGGQGEDEEDPAGAHLSVPGDKGAGHDPERDP